ncbi:hypothetical protein AWQ21_02475 [Picosynechococcus sp. PCC 7003]|uniref:hypothetical protein n=1 Tax=Picosynechococcus sp. PCC 7003 TaxID=374981 RepID=UPI000810D372|nr:hypothetical protein [Picosynechococcus sp. PCC 7003]ANV83343.1 hypothetical protein AWQ21_02475 [Picosynechococcus sp. PCC 7003]
MKKFDARPSRPQLDADEGWVVQVYGSNRRLLWVLEPSHGWMFLIGCGVGLLLSIIWVNVAHYSPPLESAPSGESTAPALQVD